MTDNPGTAFVIEQLGRALAAAEQTIQDLQVQLAAARADLETARTSLPAPTDL